MTKKRTHLSIRAAGLILLLSGVGVVLAGWLTQASAAESTTIKVTKTASVTAGVVEGTISITNTGKKPASIRSFIDTLEVRFPPGVTPPAPPPGSGAKWFEVADVSGLQVVPNPIPVGQTASIDYEFDPCDAEDYTGANLMRNVVEVTLLNGSGGKLKIYLTSSPSFAPPSQANCAACGNGTVEGTEECDDGNSLSGDGCSAICRTEACGNGTVEGAEECDDGNSLSGDGCSAICRTEACGNGTVEGAEECDDGNSLSGDGCSAICRTEA